MKRVALVQNVKEGLFEKSKKRKKVRKSIKKKRTQGGENLTSYLSYLELLSP